MEACEPSLNDGTTEGHVPNIFLPRQLKKSIINLPRELLEKKNMFLVLAYFKLLLSMALFWGILHFLQLMYIIISRDEMFNHGVAWTALGIDVVDIIIGVVFIASVYKKNQMLMEMYYRYSIYVISLLSVLCCLLFHLLYGNIFSLLITILLFILVIRVSKPMGEGRSIEAEWHNGVPDSK